MHADPVVHPRGFPMKTKTYPVAKPVLPVTPLPAGVPANPFPPSAELGEALGRLAEKQVEIDRRKAEELARLRAIQDRD